MDAQGTTRDVSTFDFRLPCHGGEVVFQVPFVAYDEGGADYETVEQTHRCPVCFRAYLVTNVRDHARLQSQTAEPPARQFARIRDEVGLANARSNP